MPVDQSHLFVCYSHDDRNAVVTELNALRESGLAFWFDEGISAGSEWPEELAQAISTCRGLLFFVSPSSVVSRNCRNEVQYARDHDKPIVAVYLEETPLPPALQLTLASTHALQRYALDRKTYRAQLIAALSGGSTLASPSSRRLALTPRRRERLLWSGLLVLALLASGYLLSLREPAPERVQARFSVRLPDGLDITPQTYFEMFHSPPLAISPDARQIVFSARDGSGRFQLYRRALDQFDTQPMPGTEDGTDPFVSPDGRWVGFIAGRSLKKAPLEGGDVETIAALPSGSGFGGASWGADGTIVYAPSAVTGLFAVASTGGTPRRLSEPDAAAGELSHVMPDILPSGRAVLFSVRMGMAPETPVIQVLDLTTGGRQLLLEGGIGARYASGRLIYGGTGEATGSLWSQAFSADDLQLSGQPERVLDSVAADLYALPFFELSATGSVVFIPPGRERPKDELFWFDAAGGRQTIADTRFNFLAPAISPDGNRIAMTQVDDARQMTLWVMDANRGPPVRLTTGGQNTHASIWSPDGNELVFTSDHEGPSNLYIKSVDTSEPLRRLTVSEQHHDVGSYSPDGAMLTYAEMHPDTNWDLWLLELDSGLTRPLLRTAAEEIQPIISPLGNTLAYTSNETGRREVYLERFPEGGHKQRVSESGGEDPLWSRDGNTLYYRWTDTVYAVAIGTGDQPQIGEAVPVYQGRSEGRAGYGKANWDIDANGRILLSTRQPQTLESEIRVIVDWLNTDSSR